MDVIAWIVFGLILGTLSNLLEPHRTMNQRIGSYFFAITGSLLGGLLADVFLGLSIGGFTLSALVVAVVVSFSLLVIGRGIRSI